MGSFKESWSGVEWTGGGFHTFHAITNWWSECRRYILEEISLKERTSFIGLFSPLANVIYIYMLRVYSIIYDL